MPVHLLPLNPRERMFVQEYLIDLNASAAWIRAGYKPNRHNAARKITEKHIADAVAVEMAARSKRLQVDQDIVLQELVKIGKCDFRKLFEARTAATPVTGVELYLQSRASGEERAFEALPKEAQAAWHAAAARIPPVTGGFFLKSPDAIDDATAGAVAGVEVVTKSAGDGEVEYLHKIKFIEKTGALNLIGRHLGMWSGTGTPRVPSDPPADGRSGDAPSPGGVVIYIPDNGRKVSHDAGGR